MQICSPEMSFLKSVNIHDGSKSLFVSQSLFLEVPSLMQLVRIDYSFSIRQFKMI